MSDNITVPELNTITTIQADDAIMLTHQNGVTEKIAVSNLTARDTFFIASGTTLTGPTLGTGFAIRILFTAEITGLNASSPLTINYNGQDYTVKVAKNGNLINFIAKAFTENNDTVYKYLQAYTVLELVYNGSNLVIVGNPIVLSGNDYKYYADGSEELSVVDEVAIDNMHSVASDAVAKIFLNTIDNTKFEMPTIAQTEVTANYTGILYMNVKQNNTATTAFYENNIQIAYSDMYTGDCFYNNFTLLIRKGCTYKWTGQATIDRQFFIPFF